MDSSPLFRELPTQVRPGLPDAAALIAQHATLGLAKVDGARAQSLDGSTKIGAALRTAKGDIVVACNAIPDGVLDLPERHERPMKYAFFEHAERRAIYEAAADGIATRNGLMFASHWPCADCARAVIEAKLVGLAVDAGAMDVGFMSRFFDSIKHSMAMLAESGVVMRAFVRKDTPHRLVRRGALLDWSSLGLAVGPGLRDCSLEDATALAIVLGEMPCSAAVDATGRIVARWALGSAVAFVRFSGACVADWCILGQACSFQSGPLDVCERDLISLAPAQVPLPLYEAA
jgi:dCMP deaminase